MHDDLSTHFYPQDAHHVAAADAAGLQAALDTYRRVRLDPFGTYDGQPLVLGEGMHLYGICTRVPAVTFPPGLTHDALLSGVNPAAVTVAPGSVLRRCHFRRLAETAFSSRGTVERCRFVDITGSSINVDNSAGGRFSENRLTRLASQGTKGWLTVRGNPARPNTGLLFELVNNLDSDPTGEQVYIDHAETVTFLGLDIERNRAGGADVPVMRFGPGVGTVRLVATTGNLVTGYLADVGAALLLTANMRTGAPFLFRYQPACLVAVHAVPLSEAPLAPDQLAPGAATTSYRFMSGGSALLRDLAALGLPLSGLDIMALAAAVTPCAPGAPLAPPVFARGPAPSAGSAPPVDQDDSAWIQAAIDTQGVALLPPGHFRANVLTHGGQGLVGYGAGVTVLHPFDPALPVVAYPAGDVARPVLADLTIEGGAVGMGFPPGSDCFNAIFSHLCLRGQGAGVLVDHASLDAITWDAVDFVGCGYGLRYTPGTENWWIDKNTFLGCRFVGSTVLGFEALSNRGCNLDAFVDSQFTGNAAAFNGHGFSGLLFVNCDFAGNGGDPSVRSDGGDLTAVGCRFAGDGAVSVLDGQPLCLFECDIEAGSGSAHAFTAYTWEAPKVLVNSRVGVPVGERSLQNAVLVNSAVADPSVPAARFVAVQTFAATVGDPAAPAPRPSLTNLGR